MPLRYADIIIGFQRRHFHAIFLSPLFRRRHFIDAAATLPFHAIIFADRLIFAAAIDARHIFAIIFTMPPRAQRCARLTRFAIAAAAP
jgi:hypothetical protein